MFTRKTVNEPHEIRVLFSPRMVIISFLGFIWPILTAKVSPIEVEFATAGFKTPEISQSVRQLYWTKLESK